MAQNGDLLSYGLKDVDLLNLFCLHANLRPPEGCDDHSFDGVDKVPTESQLRRRYYHVIGKRSRLEDSEKHCETLNNAMTYLWGDFPARWRHWPRRGREPDWTCCQSASAVAEQYPRTTKGLVHDPIVVSDNEDDGDCSYAGGDFGQDNSDFGQDKDSNCSRDNSDFGHDDGDFSHAQDKNFQDDRNIPLAAISDGPSTIIEHERNGLKLSSCRQVRCCQGYFTVRSLIKHIWETHIDRSGSKQPWIPPRGACAYGCSSKPNSKPNSNNTRHENSVHYQCSCGDVLSKSTLRRHSSCDEPAKINAFQYFRSKLVTFLPKATAERLTTALTTLSPTVRETLEQMSDRDLVAMFRGSLNRVRELEDMPRGSAGASYTASQLVLSEPNLSNRDDSRPV